MKFSEIYNDIINEGDEDLSKTISKIMASNPLKKTSSTVAANPLTTKKPDAIQQPIQSNQSTQPTDSNDQQDNTSDEGDQPDPDQIEAMKKFEDFMKLNPKIAEQLKNLIQPKPGQTVQPTQQQ